jgi:hypothetical protein
MIAITGKFLFEKGAFSDQSVAAAPRYSIWYLEIFDKMLVLFIGKYILFILVAFININN